MENDKKMSLCGAYVVGPWLNTPCDLFVLLATKGPELWPIIARIKSTIVAGVEYALKRTVGLGWQNPGGNCPAIRKKLRVIGVGSEPSIRLSY
jgi:hypothetical protein